MTTAIEIPSYRRELNKRYEDVDDVASAAMNRATHDLLSESDYVETLTRSGELVAAGFDQVDIETDKLVTTIQLRRVIGIGVGATERNKVLRELYVPKK